MRQADGRTEHEAMPPLAGIKTASNLWLHQYDFRTPNTHGCDLEKRIWRGVPHRLSGAEASARQLAAEREGHEAAGEAHEAEEQAEEEERAALREL